MSGQQGLPFLNPKEGDRRRDEGIKAVTEPPKDADWQVEVRMIIQELADTGKPFSCDDVRVRAAQEGLPEPHHPNAWGAAMRTAGGKRVGLIEPTGRHVKSAIPSRHSAIVKEWIAKQPRRES